MTTTALQVLIPASHLKAALLFAGDDGVRGYLNGVCVEHSANGVRLLATDGKRAIVTNVPNGEAATGSDVRYVIGRDVLKRALATKAQQIAVSYTQTTAPDPTDRTHPGVTVIGAAVITVDDITTKDLQDAAGRFPEWTRIVPVQASCERAHYSTDYLSDCTKAKRLLAGKSGNTTAYIAHNGDGPGLVILSDDAFAIVMPVGAGKEGVPTTPPDWFTGAVTKATA